MNQQAILKFCRFDDAYYDSEAAVECLYSAWLSIQYLALAVKVCAAAESYLRAVDCVEVASGNLLTFSPILAYLRDGHRAQLDS